LTVQSVSARKTAGSRKTAWLAWLTWALAVASVMANLPFEYLNDPSTVLSDVFGALVWLAFATVGALIVSRRPENRIGWIFSTGTLLLALGGIALEYGVYTLITAPRSLPGGEWMAWFGGWARTLGFFTLIGFVPLLFPNGKLPSARWRPGAWFAVGYLAAFTVIDMFGPTNEDLRLAFVHNPIGMTITPDLYNALGAIRFLGFAVIAAVGAAAVLVRFRRDRGEEREQLKWFAYAAVLAVVVVVVILIGVLSLPDVVMIKVGAALFDLSVAGFPLAVGIAILKYRLYDIDLLINRTLVYVPLTGIIAGIFAASITLSQKLFVALTGQQSEAATVLTTLIVVAAFDPIKNGLQHLVDRRFKEGIDPAKQFKAYGNQVDAVVHVLRADESARRLLEEAVKAFDATGGAVFLMRHGERQMVQHSGAPSGEYALSVPLVAESREVGLLSLGARKNGMEYGEDERALVQLVANSVAAAVALTEQMDGARELART
jgi:two-component system NarL family sensor kinase